MIVAALTRRYGLLLIIALFGASSLRAQDAKVWAIGLSGGASFGVNESQNQALGPQLRVSAVWFRGLGEYLTPEIGIGLVGNSGENPPSGFSDYRNSMMPIDLRLRLTPLQSKAWSPYLYCGFGITTYSLSVEPLNKAADSKSSGVTAFVPLGAGLYHRLSDRWGMELSAGWNAGQG